MLGEGYVAVGSTGFEIWSSDDLAHYESYVEQIVQCVLAGEYEEWVHRDEGRDKAFARFRNVPGSRILNNLLWLPRWGRDAYDHVRYEPY